MLARIARGLKLAEALEAKLALRADRPDPVRTPRAFSPGKPRSPRAQTPQQSNKDPALAALPTAEEIAELFRTRRLHAVLLQICSDLGILPCDRFWRDATDVLVESGGSFLKLWNDALDRADFTRFIPPDTPINPALLLQRPEPRRVSLAVVSTGPP